MHKNFILNNYHNVFANILLDTDHLTSEQINNLLYLLKIPAVNFKVNYLASHNKKASLLSKVGTQIQIEKAIEPSDYCRERMKQMGIDYCISNIIGNNSASIYRLPLVNYNDFMEIIRVLLIHNQVFYPAFNINETELGYLTIRKNYLFTSLNGLWTYAISKEPNNKLELNLDSIFNRMKQLIICFDECSFYCIEGYGNSSIPRALLFFNSFVSQLVSIFNNLAMTAKIFDGLNYDDRKLDFRKSMPRPRSEHQKNFFDIIKENDQDLFECISQTDFQNFLSLIQTPLRNNMIHNNLPTGVNSKTELGIEIDEPTWNWITKLSASQPQETFIFPQHEPNGKVIIGIYPFLKFLMIFAKKYINATLDKFDVATRAKKEGIELKNNHNLMDCRNTLYYSTYWLN